MYYYVWPGPVRDRRDVLRLIFGERKKLEIFLSISSYFVIFDAGGVSLRSGTAASLRDRRDSWRLIFAKYFSLFVNIFFCFFIFGQICCTGRPGETGETFGGKYLQIFLFIVCQHFFPYSHIWSYLLLRPGSFCERQEGRLDASEWKLRPLSFATFSFCFYKLTKKTLGGAKSQPIVVFIV